MGASGPRPRWRWSAYRYGFLRCIRRVNRNKKEAIDPVIKILKVRVLTPRPAKNEIGTSRRATFETARHTPYPTPGPPHSKMQKRGTQVSAHARANQHSVDSVGQRRWSDKTSNQMSREGGGKEHEGVDVAVPVGDGFDLASKLKFCSVRFLLAFFMLPKRCNKKKFHEYRNVFPLINSIR